jgi:hypothetical protein
MMDLERVVKKGINIAGLENKTIDASPISG